MNQFLRIINWIRSREIVVLLACLAAVVGTWAFIKLADEVKEKDTQNFDERMIRALRTKENPAIPIGPPWLHEVGRDITALGGVAVIAGMTFVVAGFLLMRKQYHGMWLVLIATGGGLAISTLLKGIIARDRPSVVPHLSYVTTSSFPSGHSMLAAVAYLTLGSLLARLVVEWRVKIYILIVALLITGAVGVSRVYMGVHYPTDVLAGWSAGLVWASICWLIARALQHRGTVEPPTEATPTGETGTAATNRKS
ncbi:MAG TPA: phosphatase PAP2 family protein [Tepidisphaeraceae bacterium]|jgi:undecaprenyl-diphosphatase|nr:phosphatase PAP2 family protein [Tepidisphaeraceae bacterium]